MLALGDLSGEQRRFVRALLSRGGSGSARQVANRLGNTANEVFAVFRKLPPGWVVADEAGE